MFKKLLTVHWPPLSTKKGGKRKCNHFVYNATFIKIPENK